MRTFKIALLLLVLVLQATPAHAGRKTKIVLGATGSGAILGLGAGLVSYPFAKSGSLVFTGAMMGAVIGAAYGFHLADQVGPERVFEYRPESGAGSSVDLAWARSGKARASFEVGVPFAGFTFDLR